MDINGDQIRALVAQPREALTIELKAWIDPTTPVAQAKIVRAALALPKPQRRLPRNRIRRQDLSSCAPRTGPTYAQHFGLTTSSSSYRGTRPTRLKSPWSSRTGMAREYPVVAVPSGVTVPVAIKGDLIDGNKALLKFGRGSFSHATCERHIQHGGSSPRGLEGHCRDLLRQSRSGRGSLRSSAPWRTYCRDACRPRCDLTLGKLNPVR